MTSARPGCMTPSAARCARVCASSSRLCSCTSAARDAGVVDPAGVVAGKPERQARHRGDRAGQAHQRAGRRGRHGRGHHVQGRSMSAAAAAISAAVGGSPCRWRSVSRTHPMSTDSAAQPVRRPGRPAAWPPPSTNSVDPPPMSTTRYGRPTGPAGAGPASSAVAPVKDRYASSWPLSTSGARRAPRSPRGRSRRHSRRPWSRWWRPSGRRPRPLLDDPRILGQHVQRAVQRLRRQAAGGVHSLAEPDDLHPAVHVGEPPGAPGPRRPPAAAASLSRSRWPRPGRRPRRLTAPAPRTHGPRAHHGPAAPAASAPSGLAPGTASSCAASACRHFTRSGMPPALCVPGGSGSSRPRRPPRPGGPGSPRCAAC